MLLAGIQDKFNSGCPIKLVLAGFKRGAFGHDTKNYFLNFLRTYRKKY
jgi:hypothetical protein